MLERINAEIGKVTAVIGRLLAPTNNNCSKPSRCRLGTARRRGRHRQTGVDVSRFPRPPPGLLSRADPAGQLVRQAHRQRHKKSNRHVAAVTAETAARHRRISRKRGKTKANVALGNTQLRVLSCTPSCPTPAAATATSAPLLRTHGRPPPPGQPARRPGLRSHPSAASPNPDPTDPATTQAA